MTLPARIGNPYIGDMGSSIVRRARGTGSLTNSMLDAKAPFGVVYPRRQSRKGVRAGDVMASVVYCALCRFLVYIARAVPSYPYTHCILLLFIAIDIITPAYESIHCVAPQPANLPLG